MEVKDLERLEDLERCGFQASELAKAARLWLKMREECDVIFLSFTSNLVASGLRGVIKELCKRKEVDVVVTAGGSIDHDIIKSYKKYAISDFRENDIELHKKGVNRICNILVDNSCYQFMEEFIHKVFDEVEGESISPSLLIDKIGSKLNESAFSYWCWKNHIPVFCPGIIDAALGLHLFFYRQKRKLSIDVSADLERLAQIVLNAERTGALILGGGISKHHTIASNILRGGLDYAIYINTSQPWDGSLSGAPPSEAISWGKIAESNRSANVVVDATIGLPLMLKLAGWDL